MTHFVTNSAGETRHQPFGLSIAQVIDPEGDDYATVLSGDGSWTVGFQGNLCRSCTCKRLAQLSALGVIPRGRDAQDVELTYEDGQTFVQFEAA